MSFRIATHTCSSCGSSPATICGACVGTIGERDFPSIGSRAPAAKLCVICGRTPASSCRACAVERRDARGSNLRSRVA